VRALTDGSHAQWQFTGAYAANALGLSDQVPAKIISMTDGIPRKVALGNLTLVFRRASRPLWTVIDLERGVTERCWRFPDSDLTPCARSNCYPGG
jgi:hypothetical protein